MYVHDTKVDAYIFFYFYVKHHLYLVKHIYIYIQPNDVCAVRSHIRKGLQNPALRRKATSMAQINPATAFGTCKELLQAIAMKADPTTKQRTVSKSLNVHQNK